VLFTSSFEIETRTSKTFDPDFSEAELADQLSCQSLRFECDFQSFQSKHIASIGSHVVLQRCLEL